MTTKPNTSSIQHAVAGSASAYRRWVDSTGLPVHTGYFVPDLRTLELGWWEERGCNAAFLDLAGQEGVAESRVTEIPPAATLPKQRFMLDEAVYVLEGRGFATVWTNDNAKPRTFEWQRHSVFMIPRNHQYQLSNAEGGRPARLLQYNYLPVVMELVSDPGFIFNNPYQISSDATDLYAEAEVVSVAERMGTHNVWRGNFFPDMAAWDQLEAQRGRGARSRSVSLRFPNSPVRSHMAVFPERTYKKAHRHGPGVVIVIPAGEGYSIMWPEGGEEVVIPWQEGSVFVPPDRWFHQHFNVGAEPARYLAFHMPDFMRMSGEKVLHPESDQIEYVAEDPSVRQRFEQALSKRGLTSAMPEEAYVDPDYVWETT